MGGECYRIVREEDEEDLGTPSSSSSSSSSGSSAASSSADFMDDATSSSSSSSDQLADQSPLFQMSDLMSELPIRRGLSNHYEGKSQSFASLSNASCLEDLAKPQVVWLRRKRLKPCRSYGGGLDAHKPLSPKGGCCNKKSARGSFFLLSSSSSSVGAKRSAAAAATGGHSGVFGARPPVHPHSSAGNLAGRALLFA